MPASLALLLNRMLQRYSLCQWCHWGMQSKVLSNSIYGRKLKGPDVFICQVGKSWISGPFSILPDVRVRVSEGACDGCSFKWLFSSPNDFAGFSIYVGICMYYIPFMLIAVMVLLSGSGERNIVRKFTIWWYFISWFSMSASYYLLYNTGNMMPTSKTKK